MMYDVIVVGAGPAGSAAAKKCAEYGLNTLMVEKERLPRDKVCGGLVCPFARTLIEQEFGDIPEAILSQPPYLDGFIFHVLGIGSQKVDIPHAQGWRRDLDYWMNQKAQAKGVEIWQASKVIGLRQKKQGFSVTIEKDEEKQEPDAKFVVGADGVNSIVRKSLFPDLKMNYIQAYLEHYEGELDMDKKYAHSFRSVRSGTVLNEAVRFSVHHKGDLFLVSFGGRIGQIKQLVEQAKNFLAENYHFDIGQKPLKREGCLEPLMHGELMSRAFSPAKGNALLVGDAAGFIVPVLLEGISPGIKSGVLAADSIKRAIKTRAQADRIYLTEVEGIISKFKEVSPWVEKITEETERGGGSLPEVLCEGVRHALKTY